MKISYFFAIGICSLFLSACSESDDLSKEKVEEQSFPITVVYDGITYELQAKTINDSLVYLDDSFAKIYNTQIKPNKRLAALAYKAADGHDIIEYYDSAEKLEKNNGLKEISDIATMPVESGTGITDPVTTGTIGRAILYDDKGFKDREVVLDINPEYYVKISNLKSYAGFNDKTSSIRVFNFLVPEIGYSTSYSGPYNAISGKFLRTCLISYEDSGFKGKVLYCVSNTYCPISSSGDWYEKYHQDWKLAKIGWNDKISSVVFRIVTVENINSGIYTMHTPID